MKNKSNQKSDKLTKPLYVGVLAFICCFLWGSAIPMIKTGYSLMEIDNADSATQILFAGVRFTLAGILVLCMGGLLQKRLPRLNRNMLKYAPILCLFQTVGQYFFFYIGVAHTTGVTGSILNATGTFFSILIACLLFRQEKLTVNKILGCILGFLGVLIINLAGNEGGFGFSFFGEGFMIFSTVMNAFSSVLIRRFSQHEDPVFLSGYQFFIGGLILLLVGICMGGRLHHISVPSASVLIWLAGVSAVAYTLWSVLLKYNPVSRIAIFGFMNPICGVFLSAIILGEYSLAFRLESLIALLFVSLGIYIVNRVKIV